MKQQQTENMFRLDKQSKLFKKEKPSLINKKSNSKQRGIQNGIMRLEDYKLGAKHRMLAALEIYNKPIFPCKVEIYAILAISAWEFLFKAILVKKRDTKH